MSQKTAKKLRKIAKIIYAMLSPRDRSIVTYQEFYQQVKKEFK